jgi:hypothetical protein
MKMSTKDAVLYLLDAGYTKYKIAKVLQAQPIMIDNYLNGAKMRRATALRFKSAFKIEVTDVFGIDKNDNDSTRVPD